MPNALCTTIEPGSNIPVPRKFPEQKLVCLLLKRKLHLLTKASQAMLC